MKTQNTLAKKTRKRQAQESPLAQRPEPIYKGLGMIEEILHFVGLGKQLTVIDCEDFNVLAHKRAEALAEVIGLVRSGELNEGSEVETSTLEWATQVLQLQMQLARLACKTLFGLCKEAQAAGRPLKIA